MHKMRAYFAFVLLLSLWTHLHAQQPTTVRSGPMVGYGEMTETMLWVQTSGPALVQYRYWIDGKRNNALPSKKTRTTDEDDYIAKIVLADLRPGTRYEYELLLNGKISRRPYRLTFITQQFWQWRTEPPDFSVAFGSCAYINDTSADRPGQQYAGNYSIFTSITEKKPDLMLWLGDNWYYREIDYHSESKMRARVARDRTVQELQPLLGSTHNYAVWDDHDFGENDADETYRLRTESLEIFKDYWANQTYGTLETPGVFFRFRWGDVEFFMLDDRFYRSPNKIQSTTEKRMFGKEQLAWLKESLVSSTATFKIIVNGNQFLARHRDETLRNFPVEYNEVMDWRKSQNISGMIILSGDRHLADLSCLRDSASYPLYDFTSSPLSAGLSTARQEENSLSVPGKFVNDARNFGMLRFDGPKDDRKVTMQLYDDNGKLRWSHVVKASELKPPDKDN